AAWAARLGWVDPLSLAIKDGLPFSDRVGPKFGLLAPIVWLAMAIVLWWFGRISGPPLGQAGERAEIAGERQGWLVLAALLLFVGIAGPDSLGLAHGQFLPQRIVLLGLVALVPVFDLDLSRWHGRAAMAALLAALALQSLVIWDYAIYSDR